MVPHGQLSRATRIAPELRRLAGAYAQCEGPPFTASDLISIATRAAEYRRGPPAPRTPKEAEVIESKGAYYDRAYAALRSALGVAETNGLAVVLGLIPEPGDRPLPRSPDFVRHAGITRLLDLRANVVDWNDEWGQRREADVWGQRAVEKAPEQRAALDAAISWYHARGDELLSGLPTIDAAICSLCGLPANASVSVGELRTRFGFPEPGELFDVF